MAFRTWIVIGTTLSGTIDIYREDEIWFHILTKFGKENPNRKPIIKALKWGCFHKLGMQLAVPSYGCYVHVSSGISYSFKVFGMNHHILHVIHSVLLLQ